MALSKELKKAIVYGVLSEAVSMTLLQLPFWIEKGGERPSIKLLGLLGGFLNLPALIFWALVALVIGWILDSADIRFGEEFLTANFYLSLVAITQTVVWIYVWRNTLKHRRQ